MATVTVRVWCLPDVTEEDLQAFFQEILSAFKLIQAVGVRDSKDITILYPPDKMKWGLGEDIIAEIEDLPPTSEKERRFLANRVWETIKKRFPHASVKCRAEAPNPETVFCDDSTHP